MANWRALSFAARETALGERRGAPLGADERVRVVVMRRRRLCAEGSERLEPVALDQGDVLADETPHVRMIARRFQAHAHSAGH